ncbi:MAG: hypothetical protein ABI641_01035 [Caldimonas sp.]
MLQAGTLVVQGDGRADVVATGPRTALGRIGGAIASIEPRRSRLHEELKRLVRFVAFAAVLLCLIAGRCGLHRVSGVDRSDRAACLAHAHAHGIARRLVDLEIERRTPPPSVGRALMRPVSDSVGDTRRAERAALRRARIA